MTYPKIFEHLRHTIMNPATAIEQVQSIFEAWLKEQKVVYADSNSVGKLSDFSENVPIKHVTHRALLICIEEIEPKECEKHEPDVRFDQINHKGSFSTICKHCGKKLKPVYEVCE